MAVNIIPPRVPFTDPRTGIISREWYMFLQQWFKAWEQGGTPDQFPSAALAAAVQASAIARDALLNSMLPPSRAPVAEAQKLASDAFLLGSRPNPDAAIAKLRQRVADDELLAYRPNNDAAIAKLRQRVADLEVQSAFPMPAGAAGSDVTLDCDTLEAIGYWQPVTDGAMGLIDNGDGEVVVAFTCTS